MTKTAQDSSPEQRAQELLASGAAAELRLLKQERRAERKLAAALTSLERDQRRLKRAQQRVIGSETLLNDAKLALHACQARRAAGPHVSAD